MARTYTLAALTLLLALMHAEVEGEQIMATCNVKPNTALDPSLKQDITGIIKLTTDTDTKKTTIYISLKGFNTSDSQTKHGFHVHTKGNSDYNCNKMEGHYNPQSFNHSGPTNPMRHVGDLGNIMENATAGTVEVMMMSQLVSLVGPNSVRGRGFVIHMNEDDLGKGGDAGSLATGNAGKRLACCTVPNVISSANHVASYSLPLLCLIAANSVRRYFS